MTTKHSFTNINRRDFLRVAGIGLGTLVGGRFLSACGQTPASPIPFAPSQTVAISASTATSLPATMAARSRPEVLKLFPDIPSKVIQTHHSGVWSNKTLVPNILRQILDASITKLTDLNDSREAWAALFRPNEQIAIKVNTFSNSLIWTHVPLVLEVTESLQDAGIPASQITIYDYKTVELTTAGYAINADGPGVRCIGMDSNYSQEPTEVMNKQIRLSNILKECDALINIPVLKSHMLAGITFAMKNHFGSFYYPDVLHSYSMREVAALNALPEIKDRTRLIIGDALAANLRYANSYPYWREDWIGDSIFMSFDPVAHDSMGLKLLTSELEKDGGDPASLIGMATPVLQYGVELGLGTNDPANINVIEQKLA